MATDSGMRAKQGDSLLDDLRETRERLAGRGVALRALLLSQTTPGDIVAEGWFYLPTFLVDDKYGDGTCTLLVRHIIAKRAKAGFRCTIKTDALDFPDEAKLNGWKSGTARPKNCRLKLTVIPATYPHGSPRSGGSHDRFTPPSQVCYGTGDCLLLRRPDASSASANPKEGRNEQDDCTDDDLCRAGR